MKSFLILMLVAFVSSANVKRQVFYSQPMVPVQPLAVPVHVQSPMMTILREQIHHLPIVVNEPQQVKEEVIEQKADIVTEAPIVQENQPIVQENHHITQENMDSNSGSEQSLGNQVVNSSPSSEIANNEQKPALVGNSESSANVRDSLLDNLPNHGNQENLPVMLPLSPNFQVPSFQQMIPSSVSNLFNPSIVSSLTPNFSPFSYSSYILPTGQYASPVLSAQQYASPILSAQQYASPILSAPQFLSSIIPSTQYAAALPALPKPAVRQFNIPTTTTIAPEVTVKENILPTKGGSVRSGVKGGSISSKSGTKNQFTQTDAPIVQHSF